MLETVPSILPFKRLGIRRSRHSAMQVTMRLASIIALVLPATTLAQVGLTWPLSVLPASKTLWTTGRRDFLHHVDH